MAENGLLKKMQSAGLRRRGSSCWGKSQMCSVIWVLLTEPFFPEETTWVAFGSVAQMCFLLSVQNLQHIGLRVSSDNWVLQVLAICREAVLAFCSNTYCEHVSSSGCNATVLGLSFSWWDELCPGVCVPFQPVTCICEITGQDLKCYL